jgi:hypothetical protein
LCIVSDFDTLLARHQPVLRYDSQEVYFADSAAEWTDADGQVLERATGELLAATPPRDGKPALSLPFLAPARYADGEPVAPGDCIGRSAQDYVQAVRRLHVQPQYRNRMYGRWATGADERVWLQYWFFYFYNDYNLVGSLIGAGLHEGDWEMVQLRLDEDGQAPDLAVYAQHAHAQAHDWTDVERAGERPVVYPARGSHASYFTAGTHWTGVWFDHADGHGGSPPIELEVVRDDDGAFAWMRWPGFWGDTKPGAGIAIAPDKSPRGPGHHPQWADPHQLLLTAEDHERFELPARPPTRTPPPAPQLVALTRDGTVLRISYACPDWPADREPAQLVVTLNSPQDPLPPIVHRVPISTPTGTAEVPADLHDAWSYELAVSVADTAGAASASTRGELPAAE